MKGLSLKAYILAVLLLSIVFSDSTLAADMTVTPSTLEMGFRVANRNSATQTVTIGNIGSAELAISSITISGGGAGVFSATAGTCTSLTPTIAAGSSCTIDVTFAPDAGQEYGATLAVASNSTVTPLVNVALSGGGAYALNLFIASSTGTGTISVAASDPVDAGLSCTPDAAYCAAYPVDTSITLTPQPSPISTFSGWNGCPMTMGDSCFISIHSAVDATATFALAGLESLINAASNGDVIKLPVDGYYPAFTMNSGRLAALSGGWNNDLTVQDGFTTIGSVTIVSGALILESIQLL